MGLLKFLGFGQREPWLIDEQTSARYSLKKELIIGWDPLRCSVVIDPKYLLSITGIMPAHAVVGPFNEEYVIGRMDKGSVIYYNPDGEGWSSMRDGKIYATLGGSARIQLGGYRTDLVERRKPGAESPKPEEASKEGYMLRFEFG
jgi:hypothetical protein